MDGRKYSTNYTDRKLLPETFGQMVSSSVRHTRSWTIGVLRAQARGIPIRRQSGGVVQKKAREVHGDNSEFEQLPYVHLRGSKCSKCADGK